MDSIADAAGIAEVASCDALRLYIFLFAASESQPALEGPTGGQIGKGRAQAPSIEMMASWLGRSEDEAKDALRELSELGFLSVTREDPQRPIWRLYVLRPTNNYGEATDKSAHYMTDFPSGHSWATLRADLPEPLGPKFFDHGRYESDMQSFRQFEAERAARRAERRSEPKSRQKRLKAMAMKQDWLCGICGGRLPDDLNGVHADHIIPLAWGGKNTTDNLQAAHASCNVSKGDRMDGGE